MLFKKNAPKIFCIGLNKTGTTTLTEVFKTFGYVLGDQIKGELLLEAWYQRDFKRIVHFSKSAEVFQDIPFSLPHTFQVLDQNFSNAKFILTERDNADQWYKSLTSFHSKLWADGLRNPTLQDLKKANYRAPGYVLKANRYIYNTPKDDPYNKQILLEFYQGYNTTVKDYFKSRPEKLLVINVSNPQDYSKLCMFINKPCNAQGFPWKNKTSEL